MKVKENSDKNQKKKTKVETTPRPQSKRTQEKDLPQEKTAKSKTSASKKTATNVVKEPKEKEKNEKPEVSSKSLAVSSVAEKKSTSLTKVADKEKKASSKKTVSTKPVSISSAASLKTDPRPSVDIPKLSQVKTETLSKQEKQNKEKKSTGVQTKVLKTLEKNVLETNPKASKAKSSNKRTTQKLIKSSPSESVGYKESDAILISKSKDLPITKSEDLCLNIQTPTEIAEENTNAKIVMGLPVAEALKSLLIQQKFSSSKIEVMEHLLQATTDPGNQFIVESNRSVVEWVTIITLAQATTFSMPSLSPQAVVLVKDEQELKNLQALGQKILKPLGILFETLDQLSNKSENIHRVLALMPNQISGSAFENVSAKFGTLELFICTSLNSYVQSSHSEELKQFLKLNFSRNCKFIFIDTHDSVRSRDFLFHNLLGVDVILPKNMLTLDSTMSYAIQAKDKFAALLSYINQNMASLNCCLVYANTRLVAEWIVFKLLGNGVSADVVIGTMDSEEKNKIVDRVFKKELKIIVTTDSAWGPQHFDGISHLVHWDLPENPNSFLARVSRPKPIPTLLFVCEDYGFNSSSIEKSLGFKIPTVSPPPHLLEIIDKSEFPLDPDGRVRLDLKSPAGFVNRIRPMPKLALEKERSLVGATPTDFRKQPLLGNVSHKKPFAQDSLGKDKFNPNYGLTQDTHPSPHMSADSADKVPFKAPLRSFEESRDQKIRDRETLASQTQPSPVSKSGLGQPAVNRIQERAKESIEAALQAAKAQKMKLDRERLEKSAIAQSKSYTRAKEAEKIHSSKVPVEPMPPLTLIRSLLEEAAKDIRDKAQAQTHSLIRKAFPRASQLLEQFGILKDPTRKIASSEEGDRGFKAQSKPHASSSDDESIGDSYDEDDLLYKESPQRPPSFSHRGHPNRNPPVRPHHRHGRTHGTNRGENRHSSFHRNHNPPHEG